MKKEARFENVKCLSWEGTSVIVEYEELEKCSGNAAYAHAILPKWTPKDGDILADKDHNIVIFKETIGSRGAVVTYAGLASHGTLSTETDRGFGYIKDYYIAEYADRCKFFEALNKAGYKWNAKKLLLTKKEEKFEPKNGDFVVFDEDCVSIFKKYMGKDKYVDYYFLLLSGGEPDDGSTHRCFVTDKCRMATDAEKQFLISAMWKSGKRWNAEKMCVENVGLERVKRGDEFYAITYGHIIKFLDEEDNITKECHDSGNYFHTRTEAEEFFEKEIKPVYKKRK